MAKQKKCLPLKFPCTYPKCPPSGSFPKDLSPSSLASSLLGPLLSSCVAKSQPGHSIIKGRRQSLLVVPYLSWEPLFLGEPPGLSGQE